MGPEATANFYFKIINYCRKKYKAIQDIDFPAMVIYSLPLSGFDQSGIVDEKLVLSQLQQGMNILISSGCEFIVMPCNTVHYFIDQLRTSNNIPIISIIDETIKKVKETGAKMIGIVGSETTLKLKLYHNLLEKKNVICINPKNKDWIKITKLIFEIMQGKVRDTTKQKVITIMKEMVKNSAEAVILGCTEIPLAISQKDVDLIVYDTLQILAEATVDFAMI